MPQYLLDGMTAAVNPDARADEALPPSARIVAMAGVAERAGPCAFLAVSAEFLEKRPSGVVNPGAKPHCSAYAVKDPARLLRADRFPRPQATRSMMIGQRL